MIDAVTDMVAAISLSVLSPCPMCDSAVSKHGSLELVDKSASNCKSYYSHLFLLYRLYFHRLRSSSLPKTPTMQTKPPSSHHCV